MNIYPFYPIRSARFCPAKKRSISFGFVRILPYFCFCEDKGVPVLTRGTQLYIVSKWLRLYPYDLMQVMLP